jgi:SAM-dependent methyltransferase
MKKTSKVSVKNKIKINSRACPVCSSRDEAHVFAEEKIDPTLLDSFAFASRKIPEYMHYRLVVCPVCDLLYANPLPSSGTLLKNYKQAAFDSSEEAHCAARTYAGFLPRIIPNIPDIKGALDIGTGDGAFLEQLLRHGFSGIIGVEPSKAPILASRKEIRPLIRQEAFRAGDFKKNSLSLITCFQTFEHLSDPLKTCSGVYRILKENGAFFIVCHNRRSFSAKLLGMKSPIFDIEHLQLFSPRSAQFILEQTGFKQVEVKPLFNSYPIHYWLKMLPLPRGIKTALVEWLKGTWIGRLNVPLPAGNMAVIGFKKS